MAQPKIAALDPGAVSAMEGATMPSDPHVRAAMHKLAETLNAPDGLPTALRVLTDGAVDAIPGADYASISVRRKNGHLETLAATDPLIDALDARQYEYQEGPCYATVTQPATFVVAFDLASDERWPRYGPTAAEAGFRAQLAALLTDTDSGSRSSLNVYSASPHAFDNESIDTAEMFATHASVAMGFVHTVENLSSAITSRQMVGQAVGIVMERYQLTEGCAFDFLVRVSQNSNTKVRTIAADMVTGLNNRNETEDVSGRHLAE